ncbi:hypothetical protein EJM73_09155 [Clostridium botulinum]|uniref:hypothetical protein n=1 Tax=Clostridium botulinum TaxID=1491 RepID=UPI001375834D|nr:hypothetical protein [Clostridium botulinum]NCI19793.1 hypothetical protein [Clostridium botulinum]NCI35831.1 hypothetical protein [Clostridium botulinum]NCI71688.1 hypothetical protein [Clostridium botulinum]NDI38880.1 hypothetical protein [Clostridium botulinum]
MNLLYFMLKSKELKKNITIETVNFIYKFNLSLEYISECKDVIAKDYKGNEVTLCLCFFECQWKEII